MRRVFAGLVTVVLGVGLGVVSAEPAAAGPRRLGPNVVRVSHGTFSAYVNGTLTGAFPMSEFRVRGNSSAAWPKKSYGVVFAEPQTPFGMPGGRSFRLLANYHDRSLLRNKVSLDLAQRISVPRWTPHSVFAELFVNGTYRGSYQLTEEITASRVGLPPATGVVAEFAADAWRKDSDGMQSKAQDPEIGSRIEALLANHVNPFLADLRRDGPDWQNRIDLASFVDYYLIREFTKDKDADFLFSNFYYTSDVNDPTADLVMGPTWDFDRSAGNEKGITTTTVAQPTGWWVRYHRRTPTDRATHMPWAQRNWYNRLVTKPAFNAAVCARWRETAPIFRDVASGGIAAAQADLGGQRVANNDRARWGGTAVERPPSRGTWRSEVRYLKHWYKKRYRWMNANVC